MHVEGRLIIAGNDINKDIKEFVSGINRGPLKSLIVNGNTISLDNITHGEDIFELVVEQAWLDMCRTLTNNKNRTKYKKLFYGRNSLRKLDKKIK